MNDTLEKCPCGQIPTRLLIQPDESGKWAWVWGDCCGDWSLEFRLGYVKPDSAAAQALAAAAWNEARRATISVAQAMLEELSRRLNKNGWQWCLVSNATPGVIRIQLSDDGADEMLWRKCIEATTLDAAMSAAEQFVLSITPEEYWTQHYSAAEV